MSDERALKRNGFPVVPAVGLWVVIIGTYLLADRTFAYWNYRDLPEAFRVVGLLTWQGFHIVLWGLAVPALCAFFLIRFNARNVRHWSLRHLLAFINFLVTAGASWFLVVIFAPAANGPWRSGNLLTIAGVLIMIFLPAVGLAVFAIWIAMWRRTRRAARSSAAPQSSR